MSPTMKAGSPRNSPRNSPKNCGRKSLPTLSLNEYSQKVEGGQEEGRDSGLNTHKFIDVHLIQKALMDLGLYPTLFEVNKMHRILQDKRDRLHVKMADFDEFSKMVELLTLAPLDDETKITLHNMFRKFGIDPPEEDEENIRHEEKVLTMEGLGILMDSLGHHDEPLELLCIFSEWDIHDRKYLDFEAFLSVMSTYMKVEQLDQKVEEDFLKVCGLDKNQVHAFEVNETRKSIHDRDYDHQHLDDDVNVDEKEITAKNLWKAIRKYGPQMWGRKRTSEITLNDVEEMVFDADVIDQSGDMKINFTELLNALEMVATKEILEKDTDEKTEKGMIRVPTGRHLAELMNMESASDTLVDRARRASIQRSPSNIFEPPKQVLNAQNSLRLSSNPNID